MGNPFWRRKFIYLHKKSKSGMRIVYMGTPEFAVATLDALVKSGHEIVGVVTMPDKPAGRGRQFRPSAVKIYAEEHKMKLLQPEKLKDESFVEELRSLNADIQVVVAFRMLPEVVWSMPRLGTINVHASLLPNYRGAAPINWAIINGEKQTGVSTFLLKQDIDTGDIIYQESVDIKPDDNAGTIHDKLMVLGAKLAVKTVDAVGNGTAHFRKQDDIDPSTLKPAPKIFKEDMHINWEKTTDEVINLIRGLAPYPAAWTTITDVKGNAASVKIFKVRRVETEQEPGMISTDGKRNLLIGTADGAVAIEELQISGKNRMTTQALLQGYHPDTSVKCC